MRRKAKARTKTTKTRATAEAQAPAAAVPKGEAALVATLGTEPQVVTLGLDALRARGEPICEIVVVHTAAPGVRQAWMRLERALRGSGDEGLSLRAMAVRDDSGREPEDIATEEAVAALLRTLYRAVVEPKRRGRRVHLLLAGGRKVMAAYAMVVAQLLFDEGDRVWHLLSAPEVERSRRMRLEGAQAPEAEGVQLVPVPVLRWALLPSTVGELLVWEDPYRAIERQRKLQEHERRELLRAFWGRLTQAERRVAELLVREGGTNAELARRLGRSPKTVANQLRALYTKYRGTLGLEATGQGPAIRARLVADLALLLRDRGAA